MHRLGKSARCGTRRHALHAVKTRAALSRYIDAKADSGGPVSNFDAYMVTILKAEGGYSNNPSDKGGETNFGITEAVARRHGYQGAMSEMTEAAALHIYDAEYWLAPCFDVIDEIMPELGQYMLETGINIGPEGPADFLQRALNVMSNQGTLYPMIRVDGSAGPVTRSALTKYLAARQVDAGPSVLLGVMRAFAVVYYVEIAERTPSQAVWEYGWLRSRALEIP